jgi:hypothetical protein
VQCLLIVASTKESKAGRCVLDSLAVRAKTRDPAKWVADAIYKETCSHFFKGISRVRDLTAISKINRTLCDEHL